MPASEIAEREPQHPTSGEFLRDIVFGANDGVVTAVGFLVGIAGSITDQAVVVLAGSLTIVAGGVSMALGNYLGVKSQKEHYAEMENVEKWEMKHKPDVEREEIREIYTNMGFDKETVDILTKKVTEKPDLWLKVMMRDELGFTGEETKHPIIAGMIMGSVYLLGGIPPLLPFLFFRPISRALIMSIMVAVIVMSGIGFFRWWLNKGSITSKIIETVIIGLIAAAVGFLAGEALKYFGVTDISI